MFDREAVFIERVLAGLVGDFPGLKIVFEHITTEGGGGVRRRAGPEHRRDDHAAASAHQPQRHVRGGMRPHAYCLPVAKRERHRLAVARAATSGSPKFFLGTDSAPHAVEARRAGCGCAGIFNAPFALESYAAVFEEEGALDRLEAFASENGPRFYGLPLNEGTVTLEQSPTRSCRSGCRRGRDRIVPFRAGETLRPGGWSSSARLREQVRRLERDPAVALGKAHVAGVDAEPHADAQPDRDQHDVAAAHILGVEAADEIGMALRAPDSA